MTFYLVLVRSRLPRKGAPLPTYQHWIKKLYYFSRNVGGIIYNITMDEQAEEIKEALDEYYANPEAYSLFDFEEIFQDRDPFEFL